MKRLIRIAAIQRAFDREHAAAFMRDCDKHRQAAFSRDRDAAQLRKAREIHRTIVTR
ncbi:hypothetical protein Q3A80_20470 [Burkholderia sp. SR8]|uniref:hypothetical protein n=1 Tax=Burkholderia sp. SR8 TaxID=3062277 RepID=UPI004062D989